jgi:hypothetical protein
MRNELLQQLLAKMEPDCYSIGVYKEGVYCMQKKGAHWEVFYGKNNLHLGSRTFQQEEDANKYFYSRVIEEQNKRIINHSC